MSLAKRKIMPRDEPEKSAEARAEELRLEQWIALSNLAGDQREPPRQ